MNSYCNHLLHTVQKCAILIVSALLLTHSQAPGQPMQPPPQDEDLLIVHYHRYDGNYEKAGLWTWDGRDQRSPEGDDAEVLASGRTDYGVYFVLDPSRYGNDDSDKERIGFIPRLYQSWDHKDGTDRYWTPDQGREVWLIGNDPAIYSEEPSTKPKIVSASIDRLDQMLIKFSTPMNAGAVAPAKFQVKDATGAEVAVMAAKPTNIQGGQTQFVELKLGDALDIRSKTYTVSADGYMDQQAVLRRVMDDAELFYTDLPLGAIYTKEATTFRVFSPLARKIEVLVFDSATSDEPLLEQALEPAGQGVWVAEVPGDHEGKFYSLRVDTEKYGERTVVDPYATNTTGFDGHARITDLRALDPEGFRPIKRPDFGGRATDAVIYEIHIRDFTIMAESGVDEDKRGKYLGFVQPGTRLTTDESIKTGIDHLKELGVTHVQILPFQDFDNNESNPVYSWGYMTSFFNAPEGWFASEFRDETRIRETKEMIKALKDANIGVILDVVYNHTGTQATFEAVAPGYYLRMKDDGSFWNGSGTGNEFRSEAPMGRQFVIDSLKFWVEEYGIDGYRFDLMGLIDLGTIQLLADELRETYPEILIYGEPWAAAGSGLGQITDKDRVRGTQVGAFNDHFRNAIKGPPDGGEPGYVQDGRNRGGVITGIAGAIDDWAAEPWQSINYVTCHDNLTLWDKLHESMHGASDADYRSMQNLSMGILSVSQGVLFFHAGAELARTKHGVHNSYNAGDEINQIEWPRKVEFADVMEYYKNMIAIRRAHPVFRLDSAAEVRRRLRFHEFDRPSENAILFSLDGRGVPGETWDDVVVLINPETTAQIFRIPLSGTFSVYANGNQVSPEPISEAEKTITVPARGMAILARGR